MRNLMAAAAALAFAVSAAGCTRPTQAQAILEGQGYTNVEITGYALFGCSAENDDFRTGFRATDQRGRTVRGVVCGGFLKGDTVRVTGYEN